MYTGQLMSEQVNCGNSREYSKDEAITSRLLDYTFQVYFVGSLKVRNLLTLFVLNNISKVNAVFHLCFHGILKFPLIKITVMLNCQEMAG